MTQKELKALEQIVEKLQAINSKLDEFIQRLDSSNKKNKPQTESGELKSRGLVNGLLQICTQPGYDDKQYCNALHQLKELEFPLSSKQIAWILCYSFRHKECGDTIQAYILSTLNKVQNKKKLLESISSELTTHYTNQKNQEYIKVLVNWLEDFK